VHPRQLEMRVRIRQRRHHGHVAEIDEWCVVAKWQGGAGAPDGSDAAAIDGAPAIQQRTINDWQEPPCADDEHGGELYNAEC